MYCCTLSLNPHTSKLTFTNLYEHIMGLVLSWNVKFKDKVFNIKFHDYKVKEDVSFIPF